MENLVVIIVVSVGGLLTAVLAGVWYGTRRSRADRPMGESTMVRRMQERAPWGIPLAIGAWVLSFEALTDAALASDYVDGSQWKARLLAGIIDYGIWVGYVGLRRNPRSVRSWVLLVVSSGATIYFQAHWGDPISWVAPVLMLLGFWVLEHDKPARTREPSRSHTTKRAPRTPRGDAHDSHTSPPTAPLGDGGELPPWASPETPTRELLPTDGDAARVDAHGSHTSEPDAHGSHTGPPDAPDLAPTVPDLAHVDTDVSHEAPADRTPNPPDAPAVVHPQVSNGVQLSVREVVYRLVQEYEVPSGEIVLDLQQTVQLVAEARGGEAHERTVGNELSRARRELGIPRPRTRDRTPAPVEPADAHPIAHSSS